MGRDANLIEKAVQLANAAIDLLGQVAGIHGARRCLCADAAADVVLGLQVQRRGKGEGSQIQSVAGMRRCFLKREVKRVVVGRVVLGEGWYAVVYYGRGEEREVRFGGVVVRKG